MSERTARFYTFLALLPYAVGALGLLGSVGMVRSVFAMLAMTFLPGFAVLSFLPKLPALLRTGVAAAISLGIFAIGATILIGTSWFKPLALLIVVLVPSSIVLLLQARRIRVVAARDAARENETEPAPAKPTPRREYVFRGIIAAAVILWAISLPMIDVEGMTDLGLLTQFPPTWYLAIGMVSIATAVYAMRPGVRPWTMFGLVAALVAMIYSTTPLIYDLPHYQWVYKHVGVTLQFMDVGVLLPDSDLYNRWPGLFALGGVYSYFAGYSDPLKFIGWAELYFIGLQTMLVAAIGYREQRKYGIAGFAALLFVLINWIGQGYYSPQAMTFTLQLAVVALLFSQLSAHGNKLGSLTTSILYWIVRKRQTWTVAVQKTDWSTAAAVSVVVFLDIAMTLTHQLTPYIMLMQVGLLWACGFIRPKWIIVPFALVPIFYLAPMIGWVDEHYGIFKSLDPFNNIKVADTVELACVGGCELVSRITLFTSLIGWLGGLGAIFIVARRRPSFRTPLFAVGMLTPFLMVLGQDYGGEAGLRLVMFCAPFGAVLVATAITTYKATLRVAMAVLITGALTIGFVVAYFGNEHNYRVTKDELTTARYYFDNARRGSVLIATVPNFPSLVSARYASFARNYGGGMVLMWENPKLRNLPELGPDEVDVLIDDIALYSKTGYFSISDEQIRYAESLALAKPGQLANFEKALIDSGHFELWYENGDERIYRLKGTTDSVARAQEREEIREEREARAKKYAAIRAARR